jgi:hypothetical protein
MLGSMRRRSAFGLGLLAAACLIVRGSTGCSTSNASDADAGRCPPNGGNGIPTLSFDEQLASECERLGGMFAGAGVSTKECGGVIAIVERDGIDTQTMYLYDPSTKACVEVAGGANGENDCIASVSGVPLATSCTYALAYQGFNGTGPFGFVDACGTDGGPAPNCSLGAACSPADQCPGGVAGCGSNCQCLNGNWQAPCPTGLPQTGSACTPEGAECGYPTSTNACGAANCYCQGGAWNCEPTCIIPLDAGTESGADAATDAAADASASDAADAAGE